MSSEKTSAESIEQVRRGMDGFLQKSVARAQKIRHPAADWHNHKED